MVNKKASNEIGYSDDTRLALLEHTIGDINKTLERFEKRFDRIDEKFDKIDEKFDRIDEKFNKFTDRIDSHFKWTIALFFGLYVTIIGGVIKATHLFG